MWWWLIFMPLLLQMFGPRHADTTMVRNKSPHIDHKKVSNAGGGDNDDADASSDNLAASALLQHVQTLLQQMNEELMLTSDGIQCAANANKSMAFVMALLGTGCQLATINNRRHQQQVPKTHAVVNSGEKEKDAGNNNDTNDDDELVLLQQLANAVEGEVPTIVETMRRTERTTAGTVLLPATINKTMAYGKNAKLPQADPMYTVRLAIHLSAIDLLRVISQKMGDRPGNDLLKKMLAKQSIIRLAEVDNGRNTNAKHTVATTTVIMPSDLVTFVRDLWTNVIVKEVIKAADDQQQQWQQRIEHDNQSRSRRHGRQAPPPGGAPGDGHRRGDRSGTNRNILACFFQLLFLLAQLVSITFIGLIAIANGSHAQLYTLAIAVLIVHHIHRLNHRPNSATGGHSPTQQPPPFTLNLEIYLPPMHQFYSPHQQSSRFGDNRPSSMGQQQNAAEAQRLQRLAELARLLNAIATHANANAAAAAGWSERGIAKIRSTVSSRSTPKNDNSIRVGRGQTDDLLPMSGARVPSWSAATTAAGGPTTPGGPMTASAPANANNRNDNNDNNNKVQQQQQDTNIEELLQNVVIDSDQIGDDHLIADDGAAVGSAFVPSAGLENADGTGGGDNGTSMINRQNLVMTVEEQQQHQQVALDTDTENEEGEEEEEDNGSNTGTATAAGGHVGKDQSGPADKQQQ